MKKSASMLLLLVGIFSLCGVLPVEIAPAEAAEFRLAPLNPKFVEWREQRKRQNQMEVLSSASKSLTRTGLNPEPIDWSHLAHARYLSLSETASLPARFDLREEGLV